MQFPNDSRIVAGFLLLGFGLAMVAWALFLGNGDPLRSEVLWIGASLAVGSGGGIMGTSWSITKRG